MQSTQNRLIELLAKHNEGFISGQLLSEELNISRSAIWKHMKALENAGYQIEAKPRVGYRIIKFPNQLSEYSIKWDLKTNWLGKTIIHKKSTISTQIDAHSLAENNAIHGTVVIADEQVGGKARKQRKWYSNNEKGVWLSIILRPDIYPYEAPQLTLFTATVLADVIKNHTNLEPKIKWPNDVLINRRKVSGILTEMKAEQDKVEYIVIGIGLNVNQSINDLPENIQDIATSLKIESSQEWSILEIVQSLLQTFEQQYDKYMESGFLNVKTKWENYGFKIGESITVNTPKQSYQATFHGIAEDGALITKMANGDIKKVYSAEIDWFKEDV